jgi:hypothetical protein
MAFNLADYETVETRLEKWHGQFPDSRIETELVEASNTRFIVICRLFKTEADAKPCSSGIASETISDRGVNATSALENCETSAIGRALANAGFAAKGKRASREEMVKVNQAETKPNMYGHSGNSAVMETALRSSFQAENHVLPVYSIGDVLPVIDASTPNEPPACEHGHLLKQGVSKAGKPYYGYVCKDKKCEARWAKITANGKWYFEGGE